MSIGTLRRHRKDDRVSEPTEVEGVDEAPVSVEPTPHKAKKEKTDHHEVDSPAKAEPSKKG